MHPDGTASLKHLTHDEMRKKIGDDLELLPRKRDKYEEHFNVYAGENAKNKRVAVNELGTTCMHEFDVASKHEIHGTIIMVSEKDGVECDISESISSGVLEWYEAMNTDRMDVDSDSDSGSDNSDSY